MGFWIGCFFISSCIGRLATGEPLQFDVTSLRPDEYCAQPAALPQGSLPNVSSVDVCQYQTHIELKAGEEDSDDENAKRGLFKKIEQIRNHSADRAVALHLHEDATLIDASVLFPISRQVVEFLIQEISIANITSRLPSIGLVNLIDLRFFDCHPGLRLHKADFSGLKNIRAIEFSGTPLLSVEEGTFTDLPTLQTLILGNDLGYHKANLPSFWRRLKCDAKNSWLWGFLKEKPGLQMNRATGEIFTFGNFTSDSLKVDDERNVACRENKAALLS